MVLEGTQFAAEQAIVIKEDFSEVRFQLEKGGRTALISIGFLPKGDYVIKRGEKEIAQFKTIPLRETSIELHYDGASSSYSLLRIHTKD